MTFLMKRKHKEGVELLTNLINQNGKNLGEFLSPLVRQYRAYGYICMGKHSKALSDLTILEAINKLDKASSYNKMICEGITEATNNKYEIALNHFSKA